MTEHKQIYMDGILKTNLDHCKITIKKDWDYLFVVDGEVGAGKSVFAQQIAHYCSNGRLKLDNICFNPKQFKEAVIKAEKYDAVIFDEAFRGLSARAAMTQTNRIVVAMLQEIRQKNLFVFIVLPSVWDLDKYVALHRCKGLFHVYTDAQKTRGFFRFYKREKLTMMFADPRRWKYKYPAAPQFKGRFVKPYMIDEKLYRKKKEESLGEYGYDEGDKEGKHYAECKEDRAALTKLLLKFMNKTDIGEQIGRNRRTVYEWARDFGDEVVQTEV